MVAEVDAVTALVVTVNVTLVAPTGTVTLAGTVAAELLLDSVTCAPPAGARPRRGPRPAAGIPPRTRPGPAAGDTPRTAPARGVPAATRTLVEPKFALPRTSHVF